MDDGIAGYGTYKRDGAGEHASVAWDFILAPRATTRLRSGNFSAFLPSRFFHFRGVKSSTKPATENALELEEVQSRMKWDG
jgi:hypothetical protein